jgi:hypothetical protein
VVTSILPGGGALFGALPGGGVVTGILLGGGAVTGMSSLTVAVLEECDGLIISKSPSSTSVSAPIGPWQGESGRLANQSSCRRLAKSSL